MKRVAVLVNTWDGYSEAWPMMMHGLDKYWHHCPWPIYWMCNELNPPDGRPMRIQCEDTNWTRMMRTALEILLFHQFELFIFLHEDYWLVERVNMAQLRWQQLAFERIGLDHLQLVDSADVMKIYPLPLSVSGGYPDDVSLWIHPVMAESDYRTSNQASLWRTQAYLDLLDPKDEESAWGFEVNGSKRSAGYSCATTLGHSRWPMKYVYRHTPGWEGEPIVKGEWTQSAVDYCEREGIPYEFEAGGKVLK